ncbi:MAG: type II toxin-antitoxin system PemK/MazF family toxin [Alphaproteobacteria bacterium]|nr:type II toxin-antitoxin system PemK/MazF family toxin [Alphaproteobacteria bacterium]
MALTAPDAYGDFIALPVTSRSQQEHGLPLLPTDLVEGALPRASWVRTDRVVTLSAGLVVKNFGRVSESTLATVAARLCAVVGH